LSSISLFIPTTPVTPRLRTILPLLALLAACATIGPGVWLIGEQRRDLRILRQNASQLETDIAAEQRERDATLRELTLAREQLAAAPRKSNASADERAREDELKTWLARLKQLKQFFVDHPDQSIPEMRLLTDTDWLRITRFLSLEGDDAMRKAAAALRTIAKKNFSNQISMALNKYGRSTQAEHLPTSILALAPYFDNPPDSAILQRYEFAINDRTTAAKNAPKWGVQEATPVDADYDTLVRIFANGVDYRPPPTGWVPGYREQSRRALKAYTDAHNGMAPEDITPLLPYFNPPLSPELVEKIRKAERDRQP
jgi:hypothetical protein